MSQKLIYEGYVPPCGIYCGTCPRFTRLKNKCNGAQEGCIKRKCKGIYVCCIDKKGLNYCIDCGSYPCSRFKKFAVSWQKLGQDLYQNQNIIKESGAINFLKFMHNRRHNEEL